MGKILSFMTDNLRSLVAGMGDETRDKAASTFYQLSFVTDEQLYAAYRSSWIASKIVSIPASDAIRKGRDWQATMEQIQPIEAEEKRLQLWPKLIEALIKARLLGGAALLIGTGDVDLAMPLDPAKIGKQGIRYLNVLDRTELTAGDLETNMTLEGYGKPRFYTLVGAEASVVIHPSRLAIFYGRKVPMKALATGIYRGWGESILEGVFKAVKDADAATSNIASLLFEANVDVINIPDFMASLADPSYSERFHSRLALAAAAKGINGMLILDGAETYARKQVSFTGLPDVLNAFLQIVSGAADIPVTRFLGQSPAGMSATGESDMKNYHDRLQAFQNLEITSSLSLLDEALIYSALGSRPPEIFYTWSPLEQMSEKELAEIGKLNAETANLFVTANIFTGDELRTVVTNQLVESGFYPGLDAAVSETGKDWEADLSPDPAAPVVTKDARPMTLYISRAVKNAAQILEWARGEGFTSTSDAADLHVTVCYSRTAVDWIKVGQAWQDEIKIPPGGPRLMERFDGGAVVLQFASDELAWRHTQAMNCGATSSYEEYQPHITISYDGAPDDLSAVTPYRGPILLGPEIFAEVDDGWKAGA